jgi:translation initiation factor IF-2
MTPSKHARHKKPGEPGRRDGTGRNWEGQRDKNSLEVVVKGDVAGTVEAVSASLEAIETPQAEIEVIQAGIGHISKSDILMAQTGSKLLIGFNVEVMPKLQSEIMNYGVEIRLYDTIYQLTEDVKKIANNLVAKEPEEKITGKAKVIATFKGGRKGIILGCEVLEGTLEVGKDFRVITVMGPAYFGKIGSLQIENNAVKVAKAGQQVGVSVPGWKKGKIGDWVECYEITQPEGGEPWRPRSGIFRFKSA